jgi:hypothetical protein
MAAGGLMAATNEVCYHPQALYNEHLGRGVAQPGSAHRSGR